jgi:hypothetical protein
LLVSMKDGAVLDCVHFAGERLSQCRGKVPLSWSLHDRLLVVLLRKSQEIALHHVSDTGITSVQTVGQCARPDDAFVCEEATLRQAAFLCDSLSSCVSCLE